MKHYHGGHHDCDTITDSATNVMLSWKMPQMWLYPMAAANVMLSWRLHEHGAITMAAITAALLCEGKKIKRAMVVP